MLLLRFLFVGATRHLYKRVCPFVRPSIRRSVGRSVCYAFSFLAVSLCLEHRVASIGSCLSLHFILGLYALPIETLTAQRQTSPKAFALYENIRNFGSSAGLSTQSTRTWETRLSRRDARRLRSLETRAATSCEERRREGHLQWSAP